MIEDWFFELMKLKQRGLTKGLAKGYTIDCTLAEILKHFKEEWQEFLSAYGNHKLNLTLKELADLSNMCDLLFEVLWKLKTEGEVKP